MEAIYAKNETCTPGVVFSTSVSLPLGRANATSLGLEIIVYMHASPVESSLEDLYLYITLAQNYGKKGIYCIMLRLS